MRWGDVDDCIRHLRTRDVDPKELRDALEQIKKNMQELEGELDLKANE